MKQNIILLLLILGITSCKKDPKPEPVAPDFKNGILCMNEGLFQQNNASLSYYSIDSSKTTSNIFASINGRGLGDTANDMISYIYMGKPYIAIAVDVSSQVEILDGLTLKSVKQIPIFNGTSAREPRSLQFYDDYLYSINFDGTVSKIDLSNFTITNNFNCGLNPESAVINNGFIYVVNSGGLNSPTYDSTISVIKLTNGSTSVFETAINCSSIKKDADNELYVISRGNYGSIPSKLLRISSITNSTIETFNINITTMDYYNNALYYYDSSDNGIHVLNTQTETISNSILIDCSGFQNLYKIQIDTVNQLIYLIDANGYVNSATVKCYGLNGTFKYEFTSGLNTGKLLFL